MGPGVLSPCLLLLWIGVWALPAGSLSLPELSKAGVTRMFNDFLLRLNRTYKSCKDEEYQGMLLSPPPPTKRWANQLWMGELPESCDWRKAGAVTAVKHQGDCGGCWAFAAVSNIESLWNIHFHKPFNLSVQEVLDCSWCGAGCRGGYVWDAFTTVVKMRGLTSEAAYPYKGKKEKCQLQHKTAAWIKGFETLPGDEEEIAAHLTAYGPVTVTLNLEDMTNYRRGISKPKKSQCSPDHINHVALLVGYGTENNIPYWIIKNSWGENWGEKGYYRLLRGTNACGITTFPVTATVDRHGALGWRVRCPR